MASPCSTSYSLGGTAVRVKMPACFSPTKAGVMAGFPRVRQPASPCNATRRKNLGPTSPAAAAYQATLPGPQVITRQPSSPSVAPQSFFTQQSADASQQVPAMDAVHLEGTCLEELHIRDFALVADQVVRLGRGVTVITGESGSGKSVLVEAFSQILGAPAPAECVRAPASTAVIEGVFSLGSQMLGPVCQLLSSCGLPPKALPTSSDGRPAKLTVRREIVQTPTGGLRSWVFINGTASSLRVLRELGASLVDTNGQHSSITLRDPNTQLGLLDRIAGTSGLAQRFSTLLNQYQKLEAQLEEFDELDDEVERERLQKMCDVVAKAKIYPGEERELKRSLKQMEARRGAVEQCGLVRMAISGEAGAGGVTDALRTIEAQLHNILMQEEQMAPEGAADEGEAAEAEEEADPEAEAKAPAGVRFMEDALDQLSKAKQVLAVAEGLVKSYGRQYQWSDAEHDETSERLARVERLMRANACRSSEDLLQLAEDSGAKLEHYYEMEGKAEDWQSQLDTLEGQLRTDALELSRRRRAAAGALRCAVESCLGELAMGGSRFDVRIGWQAVAQDRRGLWVEEEEARVVSEAGGSAYALGARGLDQVEFLLAAGPNEPLRPLAAVASGGESARVMLALKAAPAQAAAAHATARQEAEDSAAATAPAEEVTTASSGAPVMILDELDSGIGARLGASVGAILRRMATAPYGPNTQIFCVTHLPQVACYASHHLRVVKRQSEDGRVTTEFSPLVGMQERAQEVAAMLGLDYDVAAEMLSTAQQGLLTTASSRAYEAKPTATGKPKAMASLGFESHGDSTTGAGWAIGSSNGHSSNGNGKAVDSNGSHHAHHSGNGNGKSHSPSASSNGTASSQLPSDPHTPTSNGRVAALAAASSILQKAEAMFASKEPGSPDGRTPSSTSRLKEKETLQDAALCTFNRTLNRALSSVDDDGAEAGGAKARFGLPELAAAELDRTVADVHHAGSNGAGIIQAKGRSWR